jgi:hypothetical protein
MDNHINLVFYEATPCIYRGDTLSVLFNDIIGIDLLKVVIINTKGFSLDVVKNPQYSKGYSEGIRSEYDPTVWEMFDKLNRLFSDAMFSNLSRGKNIFYIEKTSTAKIAGETKKTKILTGPVSFFCFNRNYFINYINNKITTDNFDTTYSYSNYTKFDQAPYYGKLPNEIDKVKYDTIFYFINDTTYGKISFSDYFVKFSYVKNDTFRHRAEMRRIPSGWDENGTVLKDTMIQPETLYQSDTEEFFLKANQSDLTGLKFRDDKTDEYYEPFISCKFNNDSLKAPLINVIAYDFTNNKIVTKNGFVLDVLDNQYRFDNYIFKKYSNSKLALSLLLYSTERYLPFEDDAKIDSFKTILYRIDNKVIGGITVNYFNELGNISFITINKKLFSDFTKQKQLSKSKYDL